MLSLVFGDSLAGRFTAQPIGGRLRSVAWALGLLSSAFACGGGDDTNTVSLADSGSLQVIAKHNLDIPTT